MEDCLEDRNVSVCEALEECGGLFSHTAWGICTVCISLGTTIHFPLLMLVQVFLGGVIFYVTVCTQQFAGIKTEICDFFFPAVLHV